MTPASPGALASLADGLNARLAALEPGEYAVERAVPIAQFTTYRLGGPAAVLVRLRSLDAVRALAEVVGEHQPRVLVVGKGSNLLVADRGFDGVAVALEGDFATTTIDRDRGRVRAGGGVSLPTLARTTAAEGWSGLEFYVGIPGSVGGAVAMNAGGHGRETRDVLIVADVFGLVGGAGRGSAADTGPESRPPRQPVKRPADALDLGYRHSNIGSTDLVLAAELSVTPAPAGECREAIAEIVRWRREHQPGGSNGGSAFRNPPGDSAGRLIDSLGLKGMRVGGAIVSPKHANFFQAEPGATADDVHALIDEVQRRVRDATGIDLVPELRMVGFDVDDERGDAEGRGGGA